ncbi:MAG: hypothetical protein HKN43_02695 [Rhodothermales bacterium]|nr:hypothetical protein [Rhodothermales bacterium]
MSRASIIFLVIVSLSACTSGKNVATSDEPAGTIIVANMSGDTVMLVDAESGTILTTVASGPAPHEVAVSQDGRWAVVTNYGDRSRTGNSLTVIDLAGDEDVQRIDLGIYERPHGIVFRADGKSVAVTSESQSVVVFVDVASGAILGTAPTEQKVSHMVAADASAMQLFTTNIVSGSITEIDPVNMSHSRVMTIGPMIEGIAVAPDGSEIWVGANREGKVLIIDTASGDSTFALDQFGFPYRLSFTADGSTVVISDPQKGEVRLVNAETRELRHLVTFDESAIVATAEIPGSTSPEGIANDRDGRFVYISMQGLNKVAAVRISDGAVVRYYDVGEWPDGIAYSPLAGKTQ